MADKGIHILSNTLFAEQNALRLKGEVTGKAMRKHIIFALVDAFGCSIATACTAYNNSKHAATKADPESTKDLGRAPEKNNGGRKKKVVAEVQPEAAQDDATMADVLDSAMSEMTAQPKAVEEAQPEAAPVEAQPEESKPAKAKRNRK